MAKRRQLALMRSAPSGGSGVAPLGSLREVLEELSRYNTAPDGSPGDGMGLRRLYGPGMVLDVPASGEDVNQAMITITEEEMAWPVLSRICKELKWKMVDLETGRAFG
jgi:hypothetical protein